MLTFCSNQQPSSGGFAQDSRPRLIFICKHQGKEAAKPRIMHKHDERFELMFVVEGTGSYNIDGRGYQVKRGDLMLFNVGVLHDENPHASDDLLLYSCGVEQLKFEGLPVNVLTPRSHIAVMPSGECYEEIRHLFEQMWRHVSAKKLHGAEIGNNLLNVLLLLCRSLWIENKALDDTTEVLLGQRIKDYIDDHYKEDIDLKSITAAISMSPFYLAHVFKDFSGYSPKHYQSRRRIGEAQNLLLSTELGVTEVANAVGYDNVNNFHRIFNNMVGIPPAKYKKYWLTGQAKA